MRLINLEGERFGRLVVLKRSDIEKREPCWDCLCDCGRLVTVRGGDIRSGHTKSCGCLNRDNHIKHGVSKLYPRMYNAINLHWLWCTNPRLKQYPLYGGDGWHFVDAWVSDCEPNYAVIADFLLFKGWDESDKSCLFEKDKLAFELGVKEIGPRTVRVVHAENENLSYTRRSIHIEGLPLSKLVRACGIPTCKGGSATTEYAYIYTHVRDEPTIERFMDIVKRYGIDPKGIKEFQELLN